MSATTRASCRRCGKHRSEVGAITWEGYCLPCGKHIWQENVEQLRAGEGEWYLHWARRSFMKARRRMLAAERAAT